MPLAYLQDVTLNYELEGPSHAPVVMFSNSLGTSLNIWDSQMEILSRTWRILRYDTRGHGNSETTPGEYSVDLLANDAIALLDCLSIQKVHFCGLSLGGLTGQAVALIAPNLLLSLTLANTAAQIPSHKTWSQRMQTVRQEGLQAIADRVLDVWFTRDFQNQSSDIVSHTYDMLTCNDPNGYAACCAAVRDADFRKKLGIIDMPTLVLVGANDTATPPSMSLKLADEIPNATLKIINNAAHISNVEQPVLFSQNLISFLNQFEEAYDA